MISFVVTAGCTAHPSEGTIANNGTIGVVPPAGSVTVSPLPSQEIHQVIVMYKPGMTAADRWEIAAGLNNNISAGVLDTVDDGQIVVIPPGMKVESAIAFYLQNSSVISAKPYTPPRYYHA